MALGFSIEDFKSSIQRKGVLENNSFLMAINPPKILQGTPTRDLTIRCESTNIPGITFMTADGIYRYGYGVPEKIPYGAMFDDLTATFIVDRAASEYKFFNSWMNGIYNLDTQNGILSNYGLSGHPTPFEVEYKENYSTVITIYVINKQNESVLEVIMHEAFPISMHNSNLSWGIQNEVVKLTMSFSYRNLFIRTVDSLPELGDIVRMPNNILRDLEIKFGIKLT